MHVLAVLAQKGGSGKSWSARSFAVAALIAGRKVSIIDADQQGTCVSWQKRRPHAAPTVKATGKQSIPELVAEFKKAKADLCIIDTPPYSQPLINLAAQHATACLLVTGVGIEDLEAVAPIAAIVKALKKPAVILINKANRNATLGLARAALGTFGLPICPVAISQLVAHQYASSEGLSAQEYDPNSKAADEIGQAYAYLKTQGII